jgi:hypothetical protein
MGVEANGVNKCSAEFFFGRVEAKSSTTSRTMTKDKNKKQMAKGHENL